MATSPIPASATQAGLRPPPPVPVLPAALQPDYDDLRRLPVFDGITNEELAQAIESGAIRRQVLKRDRFVADRQSIAAGEAAPIVLIASGQITAAVFEESQLAERLAEQVRFDGLDEEEREEASLLRPPPLARVARKNLALFVDGDLFNAGALAAGTGLPVAFYTAAPTTVALLSQRAVAELAVRYPFFEARFRRSIQASRERLKNLAGVKQEVLDFFIRQGISVAGDMVRVRQLDRCIDCKQCEEACEERYGSRRLTLGGYQLGMLDFIYTCRTCTDQRCVDPCEYDSIKFDPVKREVVINEASCTGCTMCAQSCPYGAIEMVDIEDPKHPTYRPEFKARLDKRSALAFGAGTPRVARARRIANKCDHCQAYGDQACISACPTGALVEISTYELFHERSPTTLAAARSGYDQDVVADRVENLPTTPFTEGIGVKDGGLAKVKRGRAAPVVLWAVGLAAWLLALIEIFLRWYWPVRSLDYAMLRRQSDFANLPIDAVIDKIDFRSGSELAMWCGVVGTSLMFIAASYPMFRRVKAFRWLASNTMWFDFHMMAGTVGPMFILLHTGFSFRKWEVVGFWSMVIVVVSGVVGRYLYTQVPDLMNGRELEELDHERMFTSARISHPSVMVEIDSRLARHSARADDIAANAGMLRTLWWLILEDLRRPGSWWRRRNRLRRAGPIAVANDLGRRCGRMMLAHRRRVLAPRAQLLLHSWKRVHVPFTILMTAISIAHIWDAFPRAF